MQWTAHHESPAWRTLGLRVEEAGDGFSRVRMGSDGLFNRRGTVHGGALGCLADAAMGIAIKSRIGEGASSATIEFKINFLQPVVGTVVYGEGKVVRMGNRTAVAMAELVDDQDATVAVAVGTFSIRQYKERG